MLRQAEVKSSWHPAEAALAHALKPTLDEALASFGWVLVKRPVTTERDQTAAVRFVVDQMRLGALLKPLEVRRSSRV